MSGVEARECVRGEAAVSACTFREWRGAREPTSEFELVCMDRISASVAASAVNMTGLASDIDMLPSPTLPSPPVCNRNKYL